MFGKGLYFADVFAKSAGYCYTNPDNNLVRNTFTDLLQVPLLMSALGCLVAL